MGITADRCGFVDAVSDGRIDPSLPLPLSLTRWLREPPSSVMPKSTQWPRTCGTAPDGLAERHVAVSEKYSDWVAPRVQSRMRPDMLATWTAGTVWPWSFPVTGPGSAAPRIAVPFKMPCSGNWRVSQLEPRPTLSLANAPAECLKVHMDLASSRTAPGPVAPPNAGSWVLRGNPEDAG